MLTFHDVELKTNKGILWAYNLKELMLIFPNFPLFKFLFHNFWNLDFKKSYKANINKISNIYEEWMKNCKEPHSQISFISIDVYSFAFGIVKTIHSIDI